MDNVIESLQMQNTMTFLCDMKLIKEESHCAKSLLATSNDDCWLLASGLSISKEKMKGTMKWRMRIRIRL